jgi:ABC-2 type transport system permease protein
VVGSSAATVALVVWIAGRAFRAGALSTGKVDFKGLIAKLRGGE